MNGWNAWRFADPWLLGFVILLGTIVYGYFASKRQERLLFPDLELARAGGSSARQWFRAVPAGLRVLAVFAIIVALARPQGGTVSREVLSEGVDIMLVADTSGSMEAMDFTLGGERATRLDVAKKVIREFISGRANDRIGLVVFGEEAFVQCPTTIDYGVLTSTLDAVRLKMAGDSTAIGSAIGVAVRSLKDLPGRAKIVILLTDGKNRTGVLDPLQAARAAATYGIKIYTIGVGTQGEAPFPVQDLFGKRFAYQKVEMDEKALTAIAEATGARYFRADSTESLSEIYSIIDAIEKTEVEVKEWTDYQELFPFALWPAVLLLFLEMTLRATWLRTLP